jgi:hypothetical protein
MHFQQPGAENDSCDDDSSLQLNVPSFVPTSIPGQLRLILGDSMSVEDFQNFRVGRRLIGSVDISMEPSVDDVHAHALSVLIKHRYVL